MAVLAIAAGGAVAGGIVGGLVPGVGVLLGAQLGFLGGSILGNILFPTKVDAGGPARDDIRLSSAATGRYIPITYGVTRVGGQYLYVQEPVFKTKEEEVGGKGGGTEVKTTTVKLTWGVGICEGPVVAITRIWLDDELIYNVLPENTGAPISSLLTDSFRRVVGAANPGTSFTDNVQTAQVKNIGPIRIYLGGEDQPVDPVLQNDGRIGEAFGGDTVDYVIPFQGLCWAMFEGIPGETVNGHFPQCEFEVLKDSTESNQGIVYNSAQIDAQFVGTTNSADLIYRLPDLTTFVTGPRTDNDSGIMIWNTIDRNISDPEVVYHQGSSNLNDRVKFPINVGPWEDPNRRFLIHGNTLGNDLQLWWMDGLTGQTILAERSAGLGVSGILSLSTRWFFWPDTLNTSHVIGVFTNDLVCVSLDWTEDDLPGTTAENLNFTIDGIGSLSYSEEEYGGFVGPDGLLYLLMSKSSEQDYAIVAFDIFSLTPIRYMYPITRESPDTDDDFYQNVLLTYDSVTDKIILRHYTGNHALRRIDRETLTIDLPDLSLGVTGGTAVEKEYYAAMKNGPISGVMALSVGDGWALVDVWAWTLLELETDASTKWNTLSGEDHVFDPINYGVWATNHTSYNVFYPLGREAPLCTTAEEIAKDISDLSGVDTTLRETALWAPFTICGYMLGRQISGRRALETIAGAINGDMRTQDGKVQFIVLDTASIKTIPSDDLGFSARLEDKVPFRDVSWPYERELPKQVDIQFIDRQLDFSSNTVGYDRPLTGFAGRANDTVQMPIVFDTPSVPQPNEIAERLLYGFDGWRRKHVLHLSWEHLNLNIGDAFDYVDPNGTTTHTVRVEKWMLAENNLIAIEARSEDISINTASGQAGVSKSSVFTRPGLNSPAPNTSAQFFIDTPIFRDIDDTAGALPLYIAATNQGQSAWPGARLLRSTDGGATWEVIDVFSADQATFWGRASTVLPDARVGIFDRTSQLTVNMIQGTLPGSVTEEDIYENPELNTLLIGVDGRWEAVQYTTAVNEDGSPDESGDNYTVSGFLRGLNGTNINTGTHQIGDFVILLDKTKLKRIDLPTTELNVERLYKIVTIGQPEFSVPAQTFTDTGASKKPYNVADVKGTRASNGNWTITWCRRTRIGGEWRDLVDVPLGEASEEYEVDVLDGSGGNVVLTKQAITTQSVTITNTEFANAGLGSGSPNDDMESPHTIYVNIYQMSETVGRGFTEENALTTPVTFAG